MHTYPGVNRVHGCHAAPLSSHSIHTVAAAVLCGRFAGASGPRFVVLVRVRGGNIMSAREERQAVGMARRGEEGGRRALHHLCFGRFFRRAFCVASLMGLLPCCTSFAPPSLAAARIEKGYGVRALRACAREPVEISHPDTGRPSFFLVPARYAGPARAPQGAHEIVLSTAESWGDGFHPTTSLSLQFLSQYVDPAKEQRVLDYGTGSAVLGLAALKLGARSVVGIDIDDEALDEV
jgi:hypothetical protein